MRLLQRWIDDLCTLDMNVFALEGQGLAGHHSAPDMQEFGGHLIALIMGQKNAIALGLFGIASCHYIDQQASVGEAVEG